MSAKSKVNPRRVTAALRSSSRRSAAKPAVKMPAATKLTATNRAVVLGVGLSLDGHIARPDDSVDFLFRPKGYSMADFFASVDTWVMGRKTYEAGLRMGGGSQFDGSTPAFVLSRSLPPGIRDGVTFTDEPVKALVSRLKKQRGKKIWMVGGGELARSFLADDLIDELYLGIVPTLIGDGIPLFPPSFPQREFRLLSAQSFSGGLLALTYERARTRSRRRA
jgi:dihydrofolate reductase